jgi:hypothetical protein
MLSTSIMRRWSFSLAAWMASISGVGVKRGGAAGGAAGGVVAGGVVAGCVCEKSGLEIGQTRRASTNARNLHRLIDGKPHMSNLISGTHRGEGRGRSQEYRFTFPVASSGLRYSKAAIGRDGILSDQRNLSERREEGRR